MKSIQFLLSFLPWIIYSACSFVAPSWAVTLALASCFFSYSKLLKGMILDWGSVFFLMLIYLNIHKYHNVWLGQHTAVMISGFFFLVMMGSVLIRHPITMQYARLGTDPRLWNNPLFFAINQQLTVILAIIFFLILVANVYQLYRPLPIPSGMLWLLLIFVQALVIHTFPKWYVRHHPPKK